MVNWIIHIDGSTEKTYDGGDSIVLLLSVLEETENVITDDDTRLAGKLLKGTHCDSWKIRSDSWSCSTKNWISLKEEEEEEKEGMEEVNS